MTLVSLIHPLERGVENRRFDDQESADVHFALGERAVGRQDFSAPEPPGSAASL
jgi:hypothetical protein